MKEIYQEMKSDATKVLNDKIGKCYNSMKQERRFDIRAKVLIGYASDKIIEFANAEQVDLIIMGTTGLRGISKIKALGSIAREVSEIAKCPIMLIH